MLCNDPQLISNVHINEPFSTSDHSSIIFIVNIMISDGRSVDTDCNELKVDNLLLCDSADNSMCKSSAQHFAFKTHNWFKADWQSLNNFLSSTTV